MQNKRFDLAIIGSGPGGYVAAIKAAQAGRSVALIEKKDLGGTCLNVGCIPTKTLLANADIVSKVRKAKEYGIEVGNIALDFAKMKSRKDQVVEKIRNNLRGLLQSNQIVIIHGEAEFISPSELKVIGKDSMSIEFEYAIIATGSEPLDVPSFPCDHKKVFNSTSILELSQLPKSLAIIGGGYIGCEFASLYAELGVKVILLEALPSILSLQGKTIAQVMTTNFLKKGIEVRTNVLVEGIDSTEAGVRVRLKGDELIAVDMALVSVGRKIHSERIGLEKAGVKKGEKSAILVNEQMQTNVPNIYAIGDVTGRFLLAHVASHQGIVAVSNIIGHKMQMNYTAVPSVIFTLPEVAMVGMLPEQVEIDHSIAIGRFPFQALGKSIAALDTEGFVEIISDKKTGQILGAQAIGHEAGTLIAEMALAINNELTIDCIIDTIHAHPTIAEAWLEAALLANDTPLHLPPKRQRK